MIYTDPFPSQLPMASSDLPATLISLEDWALVNVSGIDSRQYLQGQLTCDVTILPDNRYSQGAHCDAKGKLWSNFLLFSEGDNLTYIERANVCDAQIDELKKYAVFSKVRIHRDSDRVMLGLAGRDARLKLGDIYGELPDQTASVVRHGAVTLLHFSQPSERFIIISARAEAERIFNLLLGKVAINSSQQWLALDIEAGQPIIDSENSAQLLPQSINLQALDGISFTKGCYAGQEMVARAKYRGANKRALYWLSGESSTLPRCGEELELKLGENWRRTGSVLASVRLIDDTIWVQAVLNNDLDERALLRVKGDSSGQLTVKTLPYSLAS